MASYIEKYKLLNAMSEAARNLDTEGITDVDDMLDAMEEELRQCVYDAPAADVAPVRHGKWLPPAVGKYGCLCSVCRAQADNDFNYCPNCGVKMDGTIEGR